MLTHWLSHIKRRKAGTRREGIRGLQISNAMHLSSWTDSWVDLPINEDLFYEKLQERIEKSTFRKDITEDKRLNVEGTH